MRVSETDELEERLPRDFPPTLTPTRRLIAKKLTFFIRLASFSQVDLFVVVVVVVVMMMVSVCVRRSVGLYVSPSVRRLVRRGATC